MPLTVMSACTRLGVDPWQEGTRLSSLPENSAAQRSWLPKSRHVNFFACSHNPVGKFINHQNNER